MADLRTDYKDDVLNINTNERRKYRMINNADGTVSFEDVTDYLQYGDSFGALDLNAITNAIINECLKRIDTVDNLESTATKLPLSANMGSEIKEDINGKVDVYQYDTYTKIARVGYVSDGRLSISVEPTEALTNNLRVSTLTFAQNYIRVTMSDGSYKEIMLS